MSRPQTPARPGDQLSRIGFFDVEDTRNLPVWTVERLAQHVGRALRRLERLDQEPNRAIERFHSIGFPCWIGTRIDRFVEPFADRGFSPGASRLQHVEGEPRGRRDQERRRILHRTAIGGLPPDPDVLHDVLGLGRAPEDAVGDAEKAGTHGQKGPKAIIDRGGGNGCLAHHACTEATAVPQEPPRNTWLFTGQGPRDFMSMKSRDRARAPEPVRACL